MEAFIPALKEKVETIDLANIKKFISTVEEYFDLDQEIKSLTELKLRSEPNRVGIDIIKSLRFNPTSEIGLQRTIIDMKD